MRWQEPDASSGNRKASKNPPKVCGEAKKEPPYAHTGEALQQAAQKQRPAAPYREPAENVLLCLEMLQFSRADGNWLAIFDCRVESVVTSGFRFVGGSETRPATISLATLPGKWKQGGGQVAPAMLCPGRLGRFAADRLRVDLLHGDHAQRLGDFQNVVDPVPRLL